MNVSLNAANIPAYVPVGTLAVGRGAYANGEMHVVESQGEGQTVLRRLSDFATFTVDAALPVLSRKVVAVVTDEA